MIEYAIARDVRRNDRACNVARAVAPICQLGYAVSSAPAGWVATDRATGRRVSASSLAELEREVRAAGPSRHLLDQVNRDLARAEAAQRAGHSRRALADLWMAQQRRDTYGAAIAERGGTA